LVPRLDVELGKRFVEVVFDGLWTDEELAAYFVIGPPIACEVGNLLLRAAELAEPERAPSSQSAEVRS
jgi:hypothetical protein